MTATAPRVWTVRTAQIVATTFHGNQKDKAGARYVHHLTRVAANTKQGHGTAHQQMAAWLHDAVEDTTLTLADLDRLGAPAEVVQIVAALTHASGQSHPRYWAQIRETPTALLVKHADLADNLNPDRLAQLPRETQERLVAKYLRALDALYHP